MGTCFGNIIYKPEVRLRNEDWVFILGSVHLSEDSRVSNSKIVECRAHSSIGKLVVYVRSQFGLGSYSNVEVPVNWQRRNHCQTDEAHNMLKGFFPKMKSGGMFIFQM